MRTTLLRRGSVQSNKPPPPIRRTASITNTANTATLASSMGSLENLPPPPAFLLEPIPQQQKITPTSGKKSHFLLELSNNETVIVLCRCQCSRNSKSAHRIETHAGQSEFCPPHVCIISIHLSGSCCFHAVGDFFAAAESHVEFLPKSWAKTFIPFTVWWYNLRAAVPDYLR